MARTTSTKKIRKQQRSYQHEEGDFSLAAVLQFLEQVSSDKGLSAAFDKFQKACDELEESGLSLENAVMAKLAIDAGLAGYSAGGDEPTRFPWEA